MMRLWNYRNRRLLNPRDGIFLLSLLSSVSGEIGHMRPELDLFDGICIRRGLGVIWLDLVCW